MPLSELSLFVIEGQYIIGLNKQEVYGDDAVIDMLDYWLENWIHRKSLCPCCGDYGDGI